MIGSISLFNAGSYYQRTNSVDATKINTAKSNVDETNTTKADTAKSADASSGLTDSQLFTLKHAGLSASEYISSYLDFWQQRSPELLKSGQATDTFSLRFEGRTFSVAGKNLGGLNLQAGTLSDVSLAQVVQPRGVPQAPSFATGKVDLTA